MRRTVAGFLLLAATMAAPLAAQDVTYTSATSMNASGALGTILRLSGAKNITQTTYIAGHRMRVGDARTASIYDVDGDRFLTIDLRKKTYTVVSLEQMVAAVDSGTVAMRRAKEDNTLPDSERVDVSYTVQVEPTDQHEKIAGYDARRGFVTLTLTGRREGQKQGGDQGSMVVLLDTWTSTDAPSAAALREFSRAYMERFKQQFRSSMSNLAAVFASNPRMKEAFQASAEQLAKMQGAPLRSTTYIVGLPEGVKFNRELALGEGKQAEAKKSGGKGLGGLFGKLKAAAEQAEQNQQASPSQSTLMSFSTEVTDIRTGVPAGVFEVPAGYHEVQESSGR